MRREWLSCDLAIFPVHQGGQSVTQQVVILPSAKEATCVMDIHGLGISLACSCRPNVTRVAPCQLLCAAEFCAPLSTPTWDVSVQPHGVVGNNNPSGANLQEALGRHRVVIGP